ncbi:MAG: hypothetical protein JOZ84_17065 [Methylobacteriaceae bacterium]|nr:hypothetical protein [Methylobacteriaceae bacterium]
MLGRQQRQKIVWPDLRAGDRAVIVAAALIILTAIGPAAALDGASAEAEVRLEDRAATPLTSACMLDATARHAIWLGADAQ